VVSVCFKIIIAVASTVGRILVIRLAGCMLLLLLRNIDVIFGGCSGKRILTVRLAGCTLLLVVRNIDVIFGGSSGKRILTACFLAFVLSIILGGSSGKRILVCRNAQQSPKWITNLPIG